MLDSTLSHDSLRTKAGHRSVDALAAVPTYIRSICLFARCSSHLGIQCCSFLLQKYAMTSVHLHTPPRSSHLPHSRLDVRASKVESLHYPSLNRLVSRLSLPHIQRNVFHPKLQPPNEYHIVHETQSIIMHYLANHPYSLCFLMPKVNLASPRLVDLFRSRLPDSDTHSTLLLVLTLAHQPTLA